MKAIPILLATFFVSILSGQRASVGGMDIAWEFNGDRITFTLVAPDDGWVGLGFNSENDIVGSNLILTNVRGDVVDSEEYFVMGLGDPRPVADLNSKKHHFGVLGSERDGKTTIQFSMPTTKLDDKHYDLKKGDSIWLICAYSMEDDFDHHSRMRRHVKITL